MIGAVLAFYYDGYCLLLRRRLSRLITKALADICWWLTSFAAAVSFWLLIISQGLRASVFIYILVGAVIYRVTVRQHILHWYVVHHREKRPVGSQKHEKNKQKKTSEGNNWEVIFDRPAFAIWRSKERADFISKSFVYKIRLNFLKAVIVPLEKRIKK